MSKTKHSWHEAKEIAYERQGGRCALCGRPVTFRSCTGHHIRNKKDNGPNTPSNCQIRCSSCEIEAHAHYRDGNPPRECYQTDDLPKFRFRKKRH